MADITGITATAASVYRDRESPGSGVNHEPVKPEIRALFGQVGSAITLAMEGGSGAFIIKDTEADLNADLAHAAGTYARVIADNQSPPQNGYYKKVGASGSGSWTFVTEDPAEAAAASAAEDAAAAEAAALVATQATEQGIAALGRAGRYEIENLQAAAALVTDGSDLGFADEYYRQEMTTGDEPSDLSGWAFTRASAAYAANAAGQLIAFASGLPKITDAGLTIEPARTNRLLQSNVFSSASWSKNNSAITPAATTGPDGTSSASLFAATGAGIPALIQSATVTAADYTFTIYAKANGAQDWLVVNFQSKGFDNLTWFDLVNGVVGQASGDSVATIEAAANGFYRCRITRPATAGSRQVAIGFSATEGVQGTPTAGQGVYVAFAQVEQGSDATNWIATTTTTVTRTADAAFFDFVAGESGFIYAEFIAPRVQNVFTAVPVGADVGSPVGFENGGVTSSNGVQQIASGFSAEEGEMVKAVLTWDATGRSFYANGGGASDAFGVGAITELSLGNSDGGLNSQIIAVVAVNGVRLSPAECVQMTGGSVAPSDFGPTTFAATESETRAVTATFGGVEKVWMGQQGGSDYRPESGVVAVASDEVGKYTELTYYQYGPTLRVTGAQIFEFFIGEDPTATTDLSVRGKVNNQGSKINARNGTDDYGAILAATGSTRVRVGSDNGPGAPAELLIQNGHATGYTAFRYDVDEYGGGGTEALRVGPDGLRIPQRASAPTVAAGYTVLWAKASDGTVQRTSNVSGTTTTVQLG